MNAKNLMVQGLRLVCLITAAFSAGCHTVGYDKSDATAQSYKAAAAEVQTQSRALETTMAALQDLLNKPAGDLRPQFEWYKISLDRLVDAAERTEKTGHAMRKKGADYLETWNRELATMTYEYVRKSSETRRVEVGQDLDAINQRYEESANVVGPLIAYLEDIRRALSTDLTPGGLAAVKGIVTNAQENAGKVQAVLASLSTDLTSSGVKLSSMAMQPAVADQASGEKSGEESVVKTTP